MVGDKDVGELPAGIGQRLFHACRIGRIDAGGSAAGLIVDEDAVIVLETGELVNVESHTG
jgi:hypothetical protein